MLTFQRWLHRSVNERRCLSPVLLLVEDRHLSDLVLACGSLDWNRSDANPTFESRSPKFRLNNGHSDSICSVHDLRHRR